MRFLNNLIGFLVDSNIWVATSVLALLKVTNIDFRLKNDLWLELFVFSSVIVGYNFTRCFTMDRVIKYKEQVNHLNINTLRNRFINLTFKLKIKFIINVFSLILSFFCFLHLNFLTQYLILIPLLLCVFYTISFHERTLRNIKGLKIYIVGVTWAIVTVLLPVTEDLFVITMEVWGVFFQRFLYILVLILPFEIRDVSEDSILLCTVPQKMGISKTKIYGVFLLLIYLLIEYFMYSFIGSYLLVLFSVTLIFLLFSKEKQSKYYSGFYVEGLPIFWYFLLIIF